MYPDKKRKLETDEIVAACTFKRTEYNEWCLKQCLDLIIHFAGEKTTQHRTIFWKKKKPDRTTCKLNLVTKNCLLQYYVDPMLLYVCDNYDKKLELEMTRNVVVETSAMYTMIPEKKLKKHTDKLKSIKI